MLIFLTSLFLSIIMFLEKYYFFSIEDKYASSFIGKFELLVFFLMMFYGSCLFIKESTKVSKSEFTPVIKSKLLLGILSTFIVFSVGTTFYLNYQKKSIHWDAIALYDARAKFLSDGMKFSEMPNLAKYDNLNKYYYLLYPPYTSVAHFYWRELSLTNSIPVSVYYSVAFTLLLLVVFSVSHKNFGIVPALFLTFLISTNESMLNIAIKEYTNLPFDLYLTSGILLLYQYLNKGEKWQMIFGFLLVSSSLWVRLLEPIWLVVVVSFAVSTFSKKKILQSLIFPMIFFAVCILEYYSWLFFTKNISDNPSFLNFSFLNIIDSIVAIFTGGLYITIFTTVKVWGAQLVIHFIAIVSIISKWKYVFENKRILFLSLIVVLSILMYFGQIYMISFQYDWWATVAMSIDRSSTFLIPISAVILMEIITSFKLAPKK